MKTNELREVWTDSGALFLRCPMCGAVVSTELDPIDLDTLDEFVRGFQSVHDGSQDCPRD